MSTRAPRVGTARIVDEAAISRGGRITGGPPIGTAVLGAKVSRTAQPNPFIGRTYIPDNPRMEAPPAWFLQRLYDFDAMLVLLPSRKVPFAYVIARRRQLSKGLTCKAIEDSIDQPDTKMCLLYDCVPVCLMYKTGPTWNVDTIIQKLAARDIWAMGGADKVADMLDAEDAAEKERIRRAIRDDQYNRSGDAWRSYQHRTGQSTILSKDYSSRKPRSKAAASKQPSSTSESTAASGSATTGGLTMGRRGN